MLPENRKQLEKYANASIKNMQFLPQGSVGEVWLVSFENNLKLITKTSVHQNPRLDVEAQMLEYLSKHSSLPVPKPVIAQHDFIAMQFIENIPKPKKFNDAILAQHIAKLHSVTSTEFGLEFDTLIGPVVQPNSQCRSWLEFFISNRLFYMGKMARDRGVVSREFISRLDRLASQLHNFISEPEEVSLMHGDLWFGNILYTSGGGVVFIDPAIYYGDSEMEVAYSQMFGGIGGDFLSAYGELRSLSVNFIGERMLIYQVYPLLVHAYLFGGDYGRQAEDIVKKFV